MVTLHTVKRHVCIAIRDTFNLIFESRNFVHRRIRLASVALLNLQTCITFKKGLLNWKHHNRPSLIARGRRLGCRAASEVARSAADRAAAGARGAAPGKIWTNFRYQNCRFSAFVTHNFKGAHRAIWKPARVLWKPDKAI